MTFGEKIKKEREYKKLSQSYISEQIPLNQSTYSKIERNLIEPNLFQLKRIVEILDLDLNYLLDIKDTEEKDSNKNEEEFFTKEIKLIYKKYFKK